MNRSEKERMASSWGCWKIAQHCHIYSWIDTASQQLSRRYRDRYEEGTGLYAAFG